MNWGKKRGISTLPDVVVPDLSAQFTCLPLMQIYLLLWTTKTTKHLPVACPVHIQTWYFLPELKGYLSKGKSTQFAVNCLAEFCCLISYVCPVFQKCVRMISKTPSAHHVIAWVVCNIINERTSRLRGVFFPLPVENPLKLWTFLWIALKEEAKGMKRRSWARRWWEL